MSAIIERKTKDGSISYLARVRRRGAKTVSATFHRKTDAKIWIAQTEVAILDGRYFDRQEERKHTLGEAIKRYLADYPSHLNRQSQLKKWNQELGHLLLADITAIKVNDTVMQWKRDLNEDGRARREAVLNRYLSTLSVVFSAAMRDLQLCLPRRRNLNDALHF